MQQGSASAYNPRWFWILRGVILVFLLLILTHVLVDKPNSVHRTIVTLGFDDGSADQFLTRPMLAAHKMHAVYYIISGFTGQPGYMTWQQLADLYADGNEIGGHTLHHAVLTTLTGKPLLDEICGNRADLAKHELNPQSFAYPFGAFNDETIQAAKTCGFSNARGVNGRGETLPPLDPFASRILITVRSDTSLSEIEGLISRAENSGGGWLQLVFHDVCEGCSDYAITPTDFNALLDWLQTRAAQGILVRTPNQVILQSQY
jgi:peptidoglycan/xylan/chitin deacetylase (PgdA/CDA1 family)